uniref:Immunoglobulin V-set domain-containing protein n=1 Tax=Salvator merianae TaxID=96440 RepID=A0A8D0B538_SALMN
GAWETPQRTTEGGRLGNDVGKVEEEVIKMQGESLKIDIFCSQLYLQTVKMWCKGELLKECNPTEPVTLSKSGWKYLTTEPNQRILLKDSRNGCFSLLMSALQVEDSGIYWFGILDDLNVIPLRKIRVTVQKGEHSYLPGSAILTMAHQLLPACLFNLEATPRHLF